MTMNYLIFFLYDLLYLYIITPRANAMHILTAPSTQRVEIAHKGTTALGWNGD